MLAAARLGDKVTHTSQLGGLIGGMLVGALVGAALVAGTIATVLTGGLALGPILLIAGAVCTGAAVGGAAGRLAGSTSWFTFQKGNINSGAATVFINSRSKPAARACIDTATCSDHPPKQLIATGSTTVFIEGYPAARIKDVGACSFEIGAGSENVFVGDETGQCAGIDITPEVPPWLETLHHAIGLVGALCLLGPAYGLRVALVSILGGELGGRLGGELGYKYGGKWGGVFGSLLGGFIGGGIPLNPRVASVINRLEVDPNVLGTAGGNIRLRPATVEQVGGRYPINSKYAGQTYPLENLPPELQAKYPNSVRFNEKGFPDFSPYADKTVQIPYSGDRATDFRLANEAAGLKRTPEGMTWHHHQDGTTMQLVPTEIHDAVRHTGGVATSGLPYK